MTMAARSEPAHCTHASTATAAPTTARHVRTPLRLLFCGALLAMSCSVIAEAPQAAATRVVSVGGGVTEIVYALNAQSRLVAVDTSSTWPATAQALPKVGYQRTLAAEGVLSLDPQLLLASHEAGPPAALQQIAAAGVRVVRVEGDYSFEGLRERVQRVAAALGEPETGTQLTTQLSQQWQTVQDAVRAKPPRNAQGKPLRVAFIMLHGAMAMGAGRDTGADALLRHAGAVNAFADSFGDYKPLSAESLVTAAPDFIITTVDGPDHASALARLRKVPGAKLTDAVRHDHVAAIDIVLALGFGPRLPQAVQTLHTAFMQ